MKLSNQWRGLNADEQRFLAEKEAEKRAEQKKLEEREAEEMRAYREYVPVFKVTVQTNIYNLQTVSSEKYVPSR